MDELKRQTQPEAAYKEAPHKEAAHKEALHRKAPQPKAMRKKVSLQETTSKKPAQGQSVLKDLLYLLVKIAAIALVFVLLFTFLFGIIRYQDPSMDPAIKDGDLVVFYRYNKSGYLPQDAIVVEYGGKLQVRRVVATAGDVVNITEDGLVINGALQQEPGIYQKTQRYAEGEKFPLTVPEGEVFVLGDGREGATDSRIYGCVKTDDTLGKVMMVIRKRGI